MVAAIPREWIHLGVEVISIRRLADEWMVETSVGEERFDAVLVAAPVQIARALMAPLDESAAELMQMEASSAVVVGFGFDDAEKMQVPPGLVFLCRRDRTTFCWRAHSWIRSSMSVFLQADI